MNIQEINALTKASVGQLTSDAYRDAFNDPQTGKQFAAKINELENAPRTAPAPRPNGRVRGDDGPAAETPASTSFDPSFDDEPAAPAAEVAAPAPAAAAPAAPGALAIWRYQPTDSQGRKLGGEQVFKYDPNLPNEHPQSLASQLTKSNMYAVRMAKERKVAEVINSVKQAATAFKAPARISILDHPEADALNALSDNALENAAMSALNLFKQNHPEFPRGEDNAVAMVRFVEKSGLNPGDGQSWEKAWVALQPYIAPELSVTEAAPAPVVEVVQQPKAAAAAAVPTRRVGGVPTGLSNVDTFNEEPITVAPAAVQGVKVVVNGKTQVVDLRTWERIPSDRQRVILRNQQNAAAIDAL